MNKRLLLSTLLVSAGLWASQASAQLLFTEGKDYTVIENPLKLQKAGQKEVIEFFSYACSHCANLDPKITDWALNKKPKDVGFYQIPAVGGRMWTFLARVKLVANELGLSYDFDKKYFYSIHELNYRPLLGDRSAAIDFIAKAAGVNKQQVEKVWDSPKVEAAIKNSDELWRQAKLDGVPAVIVNGKYLVRLISYENFFSTIDFLLASTKVAPIKNATSAEVKPAEAKPAEVKPVETKSVEVKPAEATPIEAMSSALKSAESAAQPQPALK